MRSLIGSFLAVATLALIAASAHAQTTLNFDDLVQSNGSTIAATYGSNAAGTPNIGVTYRTFNGANDATIFNLLDFWNLGYGDLTKVAIARSDPAGAEIILTPQPGFSVTLGSFQLAGFPKANRPSLFVRVEDAAGTILVDFGAPLITGTGQNTFAPNVTSTGPVRIQFGTDQDIGIDNIVYSQAGIAATAPEPATVSLLFIGMVGIAVRRRK